MIRPSSNNAVWIISQVTMTGLLLCGLSLLAAASAHSIAPSQYTIDLFIDPAKNTFSGSLTIDARIPIGGPTTFTLNNNGLDIATVSVVQGGSNIFSAMVTNATTQTTKISTSEGLTTGSQVVVTISYQGNVSSEPTGLYSFVDQGSTIYMTNLYPIHARKLFPCFDEPGIAVPIKLSVTVPTDLGKFISTSGEISPTQLPNGYKQYQVPATIPIAPYSLFFTLGAWDNNAYSVQYCNFYVPQSLSGLSNLIDNNFQYLMVGTSNILKLMELSVNPVNVFISPVLASNSYTGLNSVVLKKDVSVTDLDETTTAIEKSNLLQITYAFYRLFYGTIARPASWADNWLTRSIPIYLSYQSLNNIPVYESSDESLVTGLSEEVLRSSWSDDSLVPYSTSWLNTPQEIIAFVTSDAVNKGVYAIKSLESFVDPGMLQSSLLSYLIKSNGTTMETTDFMNFLNSTLQFKIPGSQTNPSSIRDILKPMVSETGYPLINVARNQETLSMLKSSFMALNSPKRNSYYETTNLKNVVNWLIPVSAVLWTNPTPQTPSIYFIDPGTSNVQVSLAGTFPVNGWALLNLEGKGMMRVNYDVVSWMLFRDNGMAFSPATRAKLVSDAFATAEAATADSSWITTLGFLTYLDNETELAPWQAALGGMRRMWSWIYETNNKTLTGSFVTYWEDRLMKVYNKLGTQGNNDGRNDPLRREVVAAMCDLGVTSCTTNLTSQYQNMVNQISKPSTDLFSVVVCNGLKGITTEQQWTSVYQLYVKSGKWYSQSLMNSHYGFLACPASSTPINTYLNIVLLKTQSMMFQADQVVPAVKAILDRPEHVDTVLSFFVQNQAALNITEDLQVEIVKEIGQRMSTANQVLMLQSLNNSTRALSPTLASAIVKAAAMGTKKAAWIAQVQDDVAKGLVGATPTIPPTGGTTATTTQPTGPTGPTGPTTSTTPAPSTTSKPGSASTFAVSAVTLVMAFCLVKITQ
uniref:Aminopeptidase N n=1 Tax=Lygus hesperus TaxID=30085 RepID=A0A146LPD1_LYGHE